MACVGVSWLQPLSSNTQLIVKAHDTVLCNFNVVNFPKKYHKRHPIAHLLGRAMVCFFGQIHRIVYADM